MKQNDYLPIWLLPLNELQYGNPYAGRPVGNNPKFMPLDNSLCRDILHSLRMHSVLDVTSYRGRKTMRRKVIYASVTQHRGESPED